MCHVDCLFFSNWIQTLLVNKSRLTPAPVVFHGCECRGAVLGMGKCFSASVGKAKGSHCGH